MKINFNLKTLTSMFCVVFITGLLMTFSVIFDNTVSDEYRVTQTALAFGEPGGGGDCCGDNDGGSGDGGNDGGGDGGNEPDPLPVPSCILSASQEAAQPGDQYTISWTGTPVEETVWKVNSTVVSASDSAEYTFANVAYERYVLSGVNASGQCTVEVIVAIPPTCDITASISVAEVGDAYTVNWEGYPNGADALGSDYGFFVNDTAVPRVGNANFTFTDSDNDGQEVFTFTGRNGAFSCSDEVIITSPVPGCTDSDALNPTPGATVDDGSCQYPDPAPVCNSFTATPDTIVSGSGAEATLAWQTTNATRVVIDNGVGNQTPVDAGSVTVAPLANTTYTLTAFNADDVSVDCPAVTVSVTTPTAPAIDIIKRDASDGDDTQSVAADGTDTAEFEIVVTNTGNEDLVNVTVTDPLTPACDQSIGALAAGASDTYTCNATNVTAAFTNVANVTGDSAVDGATVTDSDPTEVTLQTVTAAPTCSAFSVTGITVAPSADVTATWTTENVTALSFSNGTDVITVTDVAAGSQAFTAPATAGTYTYTLTFDGETNAACVATLTVENTTSAPTPAIDIVKRAADGTDSQTVDEGDTANFEIVVTNTGDVDLENVTVTDPLETSCDLSIGSLAVGESNTHTCSTSNVTADFTNVADVTGDPVGGGDAVTDTDPTTVDVNTGGGGGGGGSASPRCELTVSAESVQAGEAVTLEWETRSTSEITLTDDRGNVIVTTADKLSSDKSDLLDDEIVVRPTRDTTYTLVAERGRRDRECTVSVDVEDDIVILETRDQAPLVAGISLTEVPYTGFEAGPVMTTLFYTLLVAWALYLTYVLVVPRTAMQAATVAKADIPTVSKEDHMTRAEMLRPDVFAPVAPAMAPEPTPVAPVATSVATAPSNLPVAPVAPVAEPVVAAAPATAIPAAPQMAAVATADTPVEVAALEAIAHNHYALVSSDAIKTFMIAVPADEQLDRMVAVIEKAKTQHPLEDGWVVINNDRMLALLVG